MGFLRRLARAVIDVDWSAVPVVAALRAAVLCALVLTWAVTDDLVPQLLDGVIGVLLVCIVDPPATEARRVRTMASLAVWGGLAALVGGLVSESFAALLVVGVVVALVAGYAGATGRTGAVVGMLSLVLFSIFSGTPVAMDVTWRDPLVFMAGVTFGGVVIMLPALLRRARGSRGAFARLARGLAHADILDPQSADAAVYSTRDREFVEMVAAESLTPAVREWLGGLGADAHRARLGMLGLAPRVATGGSGSDTERDAVVAFLRAARRSWGASAAAITWPWRRRTLVPARTALGAAYDALAAVAAPETLRVATEVRDGLDGVAATLLAAWPLGARGPRAATAPPPPGPGVGHALRAHLHRDDPIARHALRLAVTFGVAIVLAHLLDFPHTYWLPMTVAWIAKPAVGDTFVCVTARVIGTAVGVVISGALVLGLDPGSWALVALVGVCAVITVGFLQANYALAISGITPFLFFLMVLGGEEIESSLSARLLATAIAGALVLLAAAVWPNRSGAAVDVSLGGYADAVAEYAALALQRDDLDPDSWTHQHTAVVTARVRATADLHAADFEVRRHRLHPETAHAVIESLHAAAAYCLACELAGPGPDDRAAAPVVSVELVALRSRLVGAEPAPGSSPTAEARTVAHPVYRSVHLAWVALDDEPARRARQAAGTARQRSSLARG
ncbi:MAG: FUSC family protein [Actinomycetota bacterium]